MKYLVAALLVGSIVICIDYIVEHPLLTIDKTDTPVKMNKDTTVVSKDVNVESAVLSKGEADDSQEMGEVPNTVKVKLPVSNVDGVTSSIEQNVFNPFQLLDEYREMSTGNDALDNFMVLDDALSDFQLQSINDELSVYDHACNDDGCLVLMSYIPAQTSPIEDEGIRLKAMQQQVSLMAQYPKLGERFKRMSFDKVVKDGETYIYYDFSR